MLISVIIPCYNVAAYITECVGSVMRQTYQEIEVICIDNNSTDETAGKLNELKLEYPDLMIDVENTPGANAARNKGLQLARGEWVQFLDADDLLLVNKIEHQVNLIRQSPKETDFIIAPYKKQYINGKAEVITVDGSAYYISAFINKCGITSSNLWNRKSLMQTGQWNEKIRSSQETELMLRLILDHNIYIEDSEVLTIIRERESGQISQSNPVNKWKQYIDIRLHYLKALRKDHLSEYKKSSGLLLDYLMVNVLTLAKYDKRMALDYYNSHIKMYWNSAFQFGFSRAKVLLIKSFGLKFFLMLNTWTHK